MAMATSYWRTRASGTLISSQRSGTNVYRSNATKIGEIERESKRGGKIAYAV